MRRQDRHKGFEPPKSAPKEPNADPKYGSSHDRERHVTGEVRVRGEVVIESSADEKSARHTAELRNQSDGRKRRVLEIASFVVLTAYAGLTAWQAHSSRVSANSAIAAISQEENHFVQDQRPYLWITSPMINRPKIWPATDLAGSISVKNFGKSPAIKVRMIAGLFFRGSNRNEPFDEVEHFMGLADANVVFDGDRSPILFPYSPSDVETVLTWPVRNFPPLPSAQGQALPSVAEEDNVAIAGLIYYNDMFGRSYRSQFCLIVEPAGRVHPCLAYNQIH